MGHAQALDAAAQQASKAFGVLSLTQRAWAAYRTRRAEHATIAMLRALDDRALRDIGIDRSEIESVVYAARADREERRIGMCL